ncbi:chorismate mutase [Paenibacillus albidus]|uniref:chorismate mutase n=1 Tax=Paenibacillus albidus TaxID=2041023 RepID=UPI001BE5F5BA|nr:chorismate mutase [Paenibacillus albidus]MBT2289242.1 chorismate mutase [Paenibacillus albidus]
MNRMPFQRPTEHYDERIMDIDEKICALIKQRKDISDNIPGFPPLETIAMWAQKYDLYEEFLKSLFGTLMSEEHFRPMVEPDQFRTYLPVLKSMEQDGLFYSLTSIRQYNNASMVTLHIDWDMKQDEEPSSRRHRQFELYIGEPYDCRMVNGGSGSGHASYNYVVSPPLPDELSGLVLVFKEGCSPFPPKENGIEIVFAMEEV